VRTRGEYRRHHRLRAWTGVIAAWIVVLSAVAALAATIDNQPTPRPAAVAPSPTPTQQSASATPRVAAPPPPRHASPAPAPQPHAAPTVSPVAGVGMWLYQMENTAGGNPAKIAWLAHQAKLTHLYVRVGSSVDQLKTLWQAASLIPYAHQYGIKVIAWYFPYFGHLQDDINRSLITINATWQGQHFDGFAPDIEPAPGSSLNASTVRAYSAALRAGAPHSYLIAVPPRPSDAMIKVFPYDAMMPYYDAVAPMVYWGGFPVGPTLQQAIGFFAKWGKAISPIGQAYDMGPEGGPSGNPSAQQTWAFMAVAKRNGVTGVSWWDWQEASPQQWQAIRLFPW
jgi:hypothetical protein